LENSINPISEFRTQVLTLTLKHVNQMASRREDVEILDPELDHAVGHFLNGPNLGAVIQINLS